MPSRGVTTMTAKRKYHDGGAASRSTKKKARLARGVAPPPAEINDRDQNPVAAAVPSSQDDIVALLRPCYELLTLSIATSNKITQRVDRILSHLGRFHSSDMSVLPGVVVLCARASAAGKLVSITELVRRRISEGDQKWYQYNRLYEMPNTAPGGSMAIGQKKKDLRNRSVIEETALASGEGMDEDKVDDDDDDKNHDGGFEVMQTPFERAVKPITMKERSNPYMGIFLSRVPVPELEGRDDTTTQSNEDQIEYRRKKRAGLI